MDKNAIIQMLDLTPIRFGKIVGFTKLKPINNYWIMQMVCGEGDCTIQAARSTYKTTCVSIAISELLIKKPNKRILFVRKTDADVKEIVEQVKKILRTEHVKVLVRELYGIDLRITKSNATELSTNLVSDIKGTSQLVAQGLGGSLTGKHFDYIFTDDIVNISDRISKAERDKTKLLYQELINLCNEGGRIINTGTPWHKDDAFSIMPPAEKFDVYCEDINPCIYNDKRIQAIKKSMLPSLFAANYELRHIASEDIIFENATTGADDKNIYDAKECHIDAAYGGGDATAFSICRKSGGKYYVLGKLWWKHVDDVIDEIVALRRHYNAGVIRCERNADKGYLAKALKQKGERVGSYHEDMNKYIKIVTYLKKIWEDVIFVEGTDQEYIDMILDYNENAEHDDAPDSLACIARKLWKRREGEEREDADYGNIYLQ